MSTVVALSLMAGVLVLNLACVITLAVVLRRKHRVLFGEIVKTRNVADGELRSLRADMRKSARELAHALEHRGDTSRATLAFHSQFGEDTYLYDAFRDRARGFFVEAGAYDGVELSNTYFLESMGWEGLLVEAHPDLYAKCKANRPSSSVVHAALGPSDASGEIEFTCVDGAEPGPLSFLWADTSHIERCREWGYTLRKVGVPYTSLDALLEGKTDKVNLLSLDTEGTELDVLRGFDIERYSPDILLVESIDAESGRLVERYLAEHGYEAVRRIGPNSFFTRDRSIAESLSPS